jgi:hypothetical protein
LKKYASRLRARRNAAAPRRILAEEVEAASSRFFRRRHAAGSRVYFADLRPFVRLVPVVALIVQALPMSQPACAADVRAEMASAKAAYEKSAPGGEEAARMTYVTKLANLMDGLVAQYRQSGERHNEEMIALPAEMKKHPAPKNSDSKKLSQLLVGRWASPRHEYVFRKDGKSGMADGPMNTRWRIHGNQYNDGSKDQTIILLDKDYFIFRDGDDVFFHSRVN